MQAVDQSSLSHYDDVIMGTMASKITSLTIVYSSVYSGADQSKHQSSASLAFVWGIHRSPVNSPYKWPVTRKMFPFDDVIMSRWRYRSLKFYRTTFCWILMFVLKGVLLASLKPTRNDCMKIEIIYFQTIKYVVFLSSSLTSFRESCLRFLLFLVIDFFQLPWKSHARQMAAKVSGSSV